MPGPAPDSLRNAYGWSAVSRPTVLHHGENRVIAFAADGNRFAARICRAEADPALLAAEAAWLEALAPHVTVPRIVADAAGSPVSMVEIDGRMHPILVSRFIDGTALDDRDPASYRRLGAALRCLHEAADRVIAGRPPRWRGRLRPRHTASRLRDAIDRAFRSCTLVDRAVSDGYRRAADRAAAMADDLPLPTDRFVHVDLHMGNVLDTETGLACLDFEECGYGPRVIDLGVVRFHLRAQGRETPHWPAFLDGYGRHGWTGRALDLGTVLRVLYAASKIPQRLDVPDIAGRAPAILRRYLDLCESLLAGR